MRDSHARPRGIVRWLLPLGWAAYLAASWTWCIGMFLPVILLGEFGLWGWVVFAVPNVVGAAAMGWILSRETSVRIVRRHRSALTAFSLVTIVFQFYFLGWITVFHAPFYIMTACGILVVIHRFGSVGSRATVLGAGAVMVISLGLFGYALAVSWPSAAETAARSRYETWEVLLLPFSGREAGGGIVGLAAVCLLGFGLCPYLDMTFHHARQQTSRGGGRFAFTFGFGGLFLAMIVFTVVYAAPAMLLLQKNTTPLFGWGSALPDAFVPLVFVHIIVQAGYTITVHLRRVSPDMKGIDQKTLLALLLCMGVPLVLPRVVGAEAEWLTGMHAREAIYRMFMGFYGLVFPAYVWTVMICERLDASRTRSLVIGCVTVVIALPFFAVGFLGGSMLWLLPGVGIVVAGGGVNRLVNRGETTAREETRESATFKGSAAELVGGEDDQ